MSNYEVIKNNFVNYYNKGIETLKKYEIELEKAKHDNNDRLIEFYQKRINDLSLKIKKY